MQDIRPLYGVYFDADLVRVAQPYAGAVNSDDARYAGTDHLDPRPAHEAHIGESLCPVLTCSDPGDDTYLTRLQRC
jgi:hypothetical protein